MRVRLLVIYNIIYILLLYILKIKEFAYEKLKKKVYIYKKEFLKIIPGDEYTRLSGLLFVCKILMLCS